MIHSNKDSEYQLPPLDLLTLSKTSIGRDEADEEIRSKANSIVTLGDVISTEAFIGSKSALTVAIGKDVKGDAVIRDIAQMPHMIISGAPGSGKSVCMRSMIMSILFKAAPNDVKLILIDPTKVEFKIFKAIPHLLKPIITDLSESLEALKWSIGETERRYKAFATVGAKDLRSYNELAENSKNVDKFPQIVIFIDELAAMAFEGGRSVEDNIDRIAQTGHIVGIHLVLATMRSTADVITETMKSNIPSRISFEVKTKADSHVIIDEAGAEELSFNGDMLYKPNESHIPIRVQGCYTSNKDITATIAYIQRQFSI